MVTKLKLVPLLFSTLAALTAGSTNSWADVLETTTALPPPNATYVLSGSPCLISVQKCLKDATVDDFTNPVVTQINGGKDQQVVVEAGYSANVYNEMTNAFIGTVNLDGTVTFVYEGRTSLMPLGSFTTDVTNFSFTGMFNGKMFALEENPDPTKHSGGTTSIFEATFTPPIEYRVSSTLTLWGEYRIGTSGPFMIPPNGGKATATLTTPEPGYMALAGTLLIGFLGAGLRRSRG